MSATKILLVDDFEPWRRFVLSALATVPGLQVVGVAEDGLEAIQKAEGLRPDLILLDIGLPRVNGLDVARQILSLAPQSKILFLSQESFPDIVREASNIGGCGYVVKTPRDTELLAAVKAVLQGERFLSRTLVGPRISPYYTKN